ncbi:transglycosylase domain-containing protein [Blastococcus sp. HT6-30]|uniref:transglycosylase domain-containing protein n=1 Tax=Blastococcus sp. HT6-30 TaxID=3144843 RepID=UPI00321BAFD1
MSSRPTAEGLLLPGVEEAPVSRPRRRGVVLRLALALVLAGALLAALALPVVGGVSVATRSGAGLLQPVSDELLHRTPPGNTRVLAADGSLIAEFYRRNRTVVPSEAIAPVMKDALVAIEDSRFFSHGGVDGKGLARALLRNLSAGEVVEGGSTLTQQLVKQIRLQSATDPDAREAATDESIGRKLREAQLALAMEQQYSKDEILTRYLNRVYFGAGAYGVAAAAETYFGVTPDALTLAQAATLAGLVQSPTQYDPFTAPERATERRDVVLARMAELGLADPAAVAEARSAPVTLTPGDGPPRGCREARIGGFFCDYALSYLTDTLGVARERIETGGLTVETTLDPVMQQAGDAAVRQTLALEDPRAGIYTAVEPGTGRVLAMSVNRIFGAAQGDRTRTTVNLPVVAGQGAGSTYKVFTAAAALEQGFGLGHVISTPDPYVSTVYRDGDGPYDVENAGRYRQRLDMEQALYMSSNTYFLALEDQLGSVEAPVRMAQRLGLASLDPVADQIVAENRGSFTFGPEATSPLHLANAYATLAAGGTRCAPNPIARVLDRDGQPLLGEDGQPLGGPRCEGEVVPPGLAHTLNQALRKDVEPGNPGQTGRRAYIPGHQIAGKTGTTQNNYSIAFVGYTPQIAASVMVYDPVENRDVGGFGGGKGAQIWHDALQPILGARQPVPFPPADPFFVQGTRATVPPGCIGRSADRCRGLLGSRNLGAVLIAVDSARPPGVVVGIDPGPGTVVDQSRAVSVLVSNGARWVPPPPPPPTPEPTPTPQPPAPTEPTTPPPPPSTEPTPEPTPTPQPPAPTEPTPPPPAPTEPSPTEPTPPPAPAEPTPPPPAPTEPTPPPPAPTEPSPTERTPPPPAPTEPSPTEPTPAPAPAEPTPPPPPPAEPTAGTPEPPPETAAPSPSAAEE